MIARVTTSIVLFALAPYASAGEPPLHPYFVIQVVDADTGRGVPLVELRTVSDMRFWTDSAGIVAFNEPGLMGKKCFSR